MITEQMSSAHILIFYHVLHKQWFHSSLDAPRLTAADMVAGWPDVYSNQKCGFMRITVNGKIEKFKRRKKLSLSHPVQQRDSVFLPALKTWSGGNSEACDGFYFHGWNIKINSLIRRLISFETTATAAFRLVITMKSILSDSHCFIVMVGAIQGCYGDCSSWQHRDVICMIAHPFSSCIEHTCCYSTQDSVWCNKPIHVAQR